jgi:hypothetical protein
MEVHCPIRDPSWWSRPGRKTPGNGPPRPKPMGPATAAIPGSGGLPCSISSPGNRCGGPGTSPAHPRGRLHRTAVIGSAWTRARASATGSPRRRGAVTGGTEVLARLQPGTAARPPEIRAVEGTTRDARSWAEALCAVLGAPGSQAGAATFLSRGTDEDSSAVRAGISASSTASKRTRDHQSSPSPATTRPTSRRVATPGAGGGAQLRGAHHRRRDPLSKRRHLIHASTDYRRASRRAPAAGP